MEPFFLALAALFGVLIGSFISAVSWRLEKGTSFVRGRSVCVHCGHVLGPLDLLPLISYAMLGGRCRYCKASISVQYPLLEVVTAALFVVATVQAINAGGDSAAVARLVLTWFEIAVLEIVFLLDMRAMLVLPEVTVPATFIGGLGAVVLGLPWWDVVLGAAVGAGIFLLQRLLSRGQWVGSGDVYIGLMLGAMLGWQGTLLALFLAYVSGAAVGVVLLATGKASRGTRIPFGTFLAAGTVCALLFGPRIIGAYLSLLH